MRTTTAILSLLLLAYCTSDKPKDYYELKVGESFSFQVKANPTTPTEWQWVNQDSVKTISLTAKVYKSDCDEDDQVAGCGGKETWTFKAINKGKEIVKVYHVSFGDSEPYEKHEIIVNVK